MTTKKVVKETPQFNAEDKFAAKKIGANMIATVGTERYARKVTMEESEVIMKKITLYNKRPTETSKKALIKLLTPETVKAKEEKEKVEAKVKGLKQQVKKEIKKEKGNKDNIEQKDLLGQLEDLFAADSEAVDKIQALLNKYKKAEEKAPEGQITKNPQRKEVYRNGSRVWIYVAEDGREVNAQGFLI